MNDFLKHSPALIPLLYMIIAISIPIFTLKKDRISYYLALFTTFFATCFSIINLLQILSSGQINYRFAGWLPPVGIEYVVDHLSAFVTVVINFIAFIVIFHSKIPVISELKDKKAPYYSAILLMLCGFNGIILTGDFFNLYVFLEISSLSMYGLLAMGNKKSPVAAFRYLIMGAVAASFYLLGVGFLYIETGSLNMADMKAILPSLGNEPTVIVALILMVVGMGIKMALFPLHGWLPDAYTYAPSTTSSIVAPTGTKVGAYVLLRILLFIFGIRFITEVVPVATVITWLAAVGIIYGSIMAIAQKEMKRMLAYSSVAQIGYIAMGIGLANKWALIGAVLHILNHAFTKALLFMVSTNLRTKLGHSDISKLNNKIRKKLPWTMAAFTIAALSMVGLPPAAGFFSKLYLIRGTIEASNWVFVGVILLSSLLNAVYFFRILEKVYMKPIDGPEQDEKEPVRDEVSPSMLIPTMILAVGILIVGIFSYFIVNNIIEYIKPTGI